MNRVTIVYAEDEGGEEIEELTEQGSNRATVFQHNLTNGTPSMLLTILSSSLYSICKPIEKEHVRIQQENIQILWQKENYSFVGMHISCSNQFAQSSPLDCFASNFENGNLDAARETVPQAEWYLVQCYPTWSRMFDDWKGIWKYEETPTIPNVSIALSWSIGVAV